MDLLDTTNFGQAMVAGLSGSLAERWSEELSALAVYPGADVPVGAAPQQGRLADRFNTPAGLLQGIGSGSPSALHAGLLVLSKLDARAAETAACICLAKPRFALIDDLAVDILKGSQDLLDM